jgi:hypothetical protein
MKLHLTYFKPGGKYHDEANVELPELAFHEIVPTLLASPLPGLATGTWHGLIHVAGADAAGPIPPRLITAERIAAAGRAPA